ncbi:MAG: Lrp/AsnC family transcriptional regulator [Saprospiraceae bacterium]|nr:Lrp/AsnC family transcriptional regulator [Saprospiraceae bacterium]
MDDIDRKILKELQLDCKQNVKEIAQKVGLSLTPTYERIRKLEQQQIIKSYVALVDRTKIGKQIIAYCQVSLIKHKKNLLDQFKQEILALSAIMECHHISGNFDFLLKIAVKDMNEFQLFINEKLAVVDGIATIHSSFVMDSVKDSTVFTV